MLAYILVMRCFHVPHVSASTKKHAARKPHACLPLSTGGSENSCRPWESSSAAAKLAGELSPSCVSSMVDEVAVMISYEVDVQMKRRRSGPNLYTASVADPAARRPEDRALRRHFLTKGAVGVLESAGGGLIRGIRFCVPR